LVHQKFSVHHRKIPNVSEETLAAFILLSFIVHKFASLTPHVIAPLNIYQFRSMLVGVRTRRVRALSVAMSVMKGVLLNNLICAPIMSIRAPIALLFSFVP
jgi:hypothetical protein